MSERQGGGRIGGRRRDKGRRGKGRGRGSEPRQGETSIPGRSQQQRDEERGATALPVAQSTVTQSQQVGTSP